MASDPFYERKPVPTEFIEDVGVTGLQPREEFVNRERKFSLADGTDARKFSKKGSIWSGKEKDPHYGRKRVSDAELHGIAPTGLSAQEEYDSRERKYSLADGTDARKFGDGSKLGKFFSGDPKDPFYGRKNVNKTNIADVAQTGNTHAEDYEIRERKQSLFQLNDDPFQQFSGRGNRASISDIGGAVGKDASVRRRSSAAAGPHAAAAAAKHYDGGNLAPIESRNELPPINAGSSLGASESTAADQINGHGHETTTATTTTTTATTNNKGTFHDVATYDDPDSVAPHEVR